MAAEASGLVGAGGRAPSLTLDNVLTAVDRVKNWERLGGRFGFGVDTASIKHQNDSIHDCLKAVIEKFLLGEGHHQPSWRAVIRSLDMVGEVDLADKIVSFGEPVQDPTLTTNNVAQVIELLNDLDSLARTVILAIHLIPTSRFHAIKRKCSTKKEISNECASYFIHYNVNPSWMTLARYLYKHGQFSAVKQLKPFLPVRDLTITPEKLNDLFSTVIDDRVNNVGLGLGLPYSKTSEIQTNYYNPALRREAHIDVYINEHPCPSWKEVSDALRHFGLDVEADEVDRTYVQVSEQTQRNFDEAMKEGELHICSASSFMMGSAGSGKSASLHAILKEKPPLVRNSTPCAKKPIRTVAQYKLSVSDKTADKPLFVRITDEQFSDMLSMSASGIAKSHSSHATKHAKFATSVADQSLELGVSQVSLHNEESSLVASVPTSSSSKSESQASTLEGFPRELLVRMNAGSEFSLSLDNIELLDFKDSAGQPMFHEVLPIFVDNTMIGFIVIKLNENLGSYPMVVYFTNGELIGKPFPSPFSNIDTIRYCIKAANSTREKDKCLKLAFIGTHFDLIHQCKEENLQDKNRKLLDIIPPQMRDSIIPYDGDSIIFPINAANPGDDDQAVLDILRKHLLIEIRKIKPESIPHRYFALEMALQRLAKYKEKALLSKEECFMEAKKFHFTRESFKGALAYLKSIKLVMHFEEVLPEVVFIDVQVLLDKITELVEHSLSESRPLSISLGEYEKFKWCGIITRNILSEFKSRYVVGLFEENDLISLFKHLLIVAEVGEGEYLMPCLLRAEPAIPHPSPDSTSLVVPALLFYFKDGPRLGVYCALLSSLITDSNWELLTENCCPVQLSRNRARFSVPGKHPGYITITDSFSTFFHIDISFPDDISPLKALEVCREVCPSIRETILAGIRKASRRLNYKDSIPEATFLCPKNHTDSLHPATISSCDLLTCTINPAKVSSGMTECHKLWLGTKSEEPACLDQVVDYSSGGVPKHLGKIADSMSEWEGSIAEQLGLTPAEVAAIKTKHPLELSLQTRSALEKWKQRQGGEATYRNLIGVFEYAGHKLLADTVHKLAMGLPLDTDIGRQHHLQSEPAVSSVHRWSSSISSIHKEISDQYSVGKDSSKTEISQEPSDVHQRQEASAATTSSSQCLTLDNIPSLGKLRSLSTAQGKKIKIIPAVASRWQELGDMMEFDKSGNELKRIKEEHQGDVKECCRAMFQHWINGNGEIPCTWRNLIAILEDCEFEELASNLQSTCKTV